MSQVNGLRRMARAWGAPSALAGFVLSSCVDTTKVAMCPVPPGQRAKVCSSAGTRPADDGLIDDFEDNDTQVAKVADRSGYWFTSADPGGSTIDPAPLKPADGGADGSSKALHLSGQTASGSGAWGALWGANLVGDGVYDASMYAGIAFKAKMGGASTNRVRFKVADINTHPDGGVCKNCWNHFGKDIALTPDWKEYKISFAEMKQEAGWGDPYPAVVPSKLFALNWSVGPGQAFDVWIDDVHFLDCK